MVKCIFRFMELGDEIYRALRMLPAPPACGDWMTITITTEVEVTLTGSVRRIDWMLDDRPSDRETHIGDCAIVEVEVLQHEGY